jgi:hypothetical protein
MQYLSKSAYVLKNPNVGDITLKNSEIFYKESYREISVKLLYLSQIATWAHTLSVYGQNMEPKALNGSLVSIS